MNSIPCLIVRDIGDYLDSHKNKKLATIRSGNGSIVLRELLRSPLPILE